MNEDTHTSAAQGAHLLEVLHAHIYTSAVQGVHLLEVLRAYRALPAYVASDSDAPPEHLRAVVWDPVQGWAIGDRYDPRLDSLYFPGWVVGNRYAQRLYDILSTGSSVPWCLWATTWATTPDLADDEDDEDECEDENPTPDLRPGATPYPEGCTPDDTCVGWRPSCGWSAAPAEGQWCIERGVC